MKAFVHDRYGPPSVLRLEDRPKPAPGPGEVVVRVAACALNASDWELLTARPAYSRIYGLLRPKHPVLGSDVAGTIEAAGDGVTAFRPGDRVFGDLFDHWGGFAEYVAAPASLWVPVPDGLGLPEAAALPQSGVIALQALRDDARLRAGEHILVNGGGGGGGSFAIQFAKALGAQVTAADSAEKAGLMRSLGADRALDYRTEDAFATPARYDVILDFVAARSFAATRRALKPGGRAMLVGGPWGRVLFAGLAGPLLARFDTRRVGLFMWQRNAADLQELANRAAGGDVTVAIDRSFPLAQVPQALAYLGAGHARGKVVIVP